MRENYDTLEKTERIYSENAAKLMRRDEDANKSAYGKLLIIAGSRGMAGAAYMSGLAALKSGIGMVRYLGPECNRIILQTLLPEAMYESYDAYSENGCRTNGDEAERQFAEKIEKCLSWADYLILGPGLSKDENAVRLVRTLFSGTFTAKLQRMKLIVVDADALNIIADEQLDVGRLGRYAETAEIAGENICSNVVITPHIGEMSRLSGMSIPEIKADPVACAESYAAGHDVNVVLKDHISVVRCGEHTYLNTGGSPALAKAGSGDVLTGVIAGVTAVLKGDIPAAVPTAVYLHGRAGKRAAEAKGVHSVLAHEITDYIYD